MESRSYLDTHVVAWLLAKDMQRLSVAARQLMSAGSELLISPMVHLELQLMYEIGRLAYPVKDVLEEASRQLGIRIEDKSFAGVIGHAAVFSWTRDPFDRLIVAQASLDGAALITKDRLIRKHYDGAVW